MVLWTISVVLVAGCRAHACQKVDLRTPEERAGGINGCWSLQPQPAVDVSSEPIYQQLIQSEIKLADGTGFGSTRGQVQPDKAHCCAAHDVHCVGQFCIAAAEVAAPVGSAEWAIHVDMFVHGCYVRAAWASRISAVGSVFCSRLQPVESGIAALGQ